MMPAPQVRKLLIKTRKLWGTNDSGFHSGSIICEDTQMDAEEFCFNWVKLQRSKRRKKYKGKPAPT